MFGRNFFVGHRIGDVSYGKIKLIAEIILAVRSLEVRIGAVATIEARAGGGIIVTFGGIACKRSGIRAERVDGLADATADNAECTTEEGVGAVFDAIRTDGFGGTRNGGVERFALAAADGGVNGVVVEHFGKELVAVALVAAVSAPFVGGAVFVTHAAVAVDDVGDDDVFFGKFLEESLFFGVGFVSKEFCRGFFVVLPVGSDDDVVDDVVIEDASRDKAVGASPLGTGDLLVGHAVGAFAFVVADALVDGRENGVTGICVALDAPLAHGFGDAVVSDLVAAGIEDVAGVV